MDMAEHEHCKSDPHKKWKISQTTKTLSAVFLQQDSPVGSSSSSNINSSRSTTISNTETSTQPARITTTAQLAGQAATQDPFQDKQQLRTHLSYNYKRCTSCSPQQTGLQVHNKCTRDKSLKKKKRTEKAQNPAKQSTKVQNRRKLRQDHVLWQPWQHRHRGINPGGTSTPPSIVYKRQAGGGGCMGASILGGWVPQAPCLDPHSLL